MKLSQFDLIDTPAANQTDMLKAGSSFEKLKFASAVNFFSMFFRRVLDVIGEFPPAAAHGQLPHPGVWAVHFACGA
jgi:hypothetical protein